MTDQVSQGKNGCSTCSEFVIIRSKNASSASLNNSVIDEQKLLLRAYRKSYMRNRLVPKSMTLTFVLEVV